MSAARALRQIINPRHAPPFTRVNPNPRTLEQNIHRLASLPGTPLTVRELYTFGERAHNTPAETRLHSARFLFSELPVRLSHRIRELSELPHGLADMPSVRAVRHMYACSLHDLLDAGEPVDSIAENDFSQTLAVIRTRHDDVVRLIAKGLIELKEFCGKGACDLQIRSFLDRFYMSRIGIRVLISHHLSLGSAEPGMAGAINTACSPANLIRHAVANARSLSYQHYGEAADVEIRGNTDLKFPYIDSHLLLCLQELLKNSLRATVETHIDATHLPPVRVIIADGEEDVTIKISDEGGGFRRSELARIWSYLFTTARIPAKQLLELENHASHSNRPDPIAGFGYGLPLSRLYARYWGGELAVTSMENYGTDAYLHLSKLGDKKECLSA